MTLAVAPSDAWSVEPERHLNQYAHDRWMRDDGAPVPAGGFAQDRDGFLWIAGNDGLYRFDGVRFEKVVKTPSNSAARGALVLRDGSVWTWFENEDSFGIYRRGRFSLVRAPRLWSIPSMVIVTRQARDGAIWIGRGQTGYPLLRHMGGRWQRFGVGAGLPHEQLHDILTADDGSVWVSYVGAILRLAPGARRFEPVIQAPGLIAKFSVDAERRIWLFERRGAYPLDVKQSRNGNVPATIQRIDPSRRRGWSLIDRGGNLWTATRYGGVERVARPDAARARTTAPERFTRTDGLSSDSLSSIFEDAYGAIWIASSRGIDRFRKVPVVAEPALTRVAAFGNLLKTGSDGTVYIGQRDAVWKVRPSGAPERLASVDEPEAMCEDGQGALIVADARAVFRIKGRQLQRLPRPPHAETGLYDCAVSRDGGLWISAAASGMYALQGTIWQPVLEQYRKEGLHPNAMIRERSGAMVMIWSPGVVARIDPPHRPVFLLRAGSPLGTATALFEGASGLLVGGEHGLAQVRDGTARYLLADRVPEIVDLNGVVQTTTGETWLYGAGGLFRLATADLDRAFADPHHVPKVKVFGFDEGVPDRFQVASWRSIVQGGDGRIWLDTLAGTAWIDPNGASRPRRRPTAAVTSLRARDRTRLDPSDVVLAKGIGDLEIGFSALGLESPNRARFRYRLVGNDDGWVDAGSRRQAFYTNLRPRAYRFEVMVANEDGIWSKGPASVGILVQPTFRQSWAFLVLCALGALLLVGLLYRWRLTRATQELARRHGERTAERERIARELHDTLLQAIQGLILTFQGVAGRLSGSQVERAKLDEALSRADEVMVEGRDRVRGLREGNGPEDLNEALGRLMCLSGFADATVLRFSAVGSSRPVSPSVGTELIAIASEALVNAARHADATHVEMVLEYRRDGITLEIRDDGTGIDLEKLRARVTSGHYGVLGMTERAKRVGAEFSVTRRNGGGTQVRVVLQNWSRLSRVLAFARSRATMGIDRS